MSRTTRVSKPAARKRRQDWPLVVYVWMAGLGLGAYLVARIALDAFPHPVHWGSALAGALIGCGIGWLWYRQRGDIL